MDVITISSSPEPEPKTVRRPQTRSQRNSETMAGPSRLRARMRDFSVQATNSVIDLSDNEDEDLAPPRKRRKLARAQSKPLSLASTSANHPAGRSHLVSTTSARTTSAMQNVEIDVEEQFLDIGAEWASLEDWVDLRGSPELMSKSGVTCSRDTRPNSAVNATFEYTAMLADPGSSSNTNLHLPLRYVPSNDEGAGPSRRAAHLEVGSATANATVAAELPDPSSAEPSGVDGFVTEDSEIMVANNEASEQPTNPGAAVEVQPEDPNDRFLALILEVVPDVDPDHARVLILDQREISPENVVEIVLHRLLEDVSYPKVTKNKGKRKRDETADDTEAAQKWSAGVDYSRTDREFKGGAYYGEMSLTQLFIDFPYIPKNHIRMTFFAQNSFYAPTHLLLDEQMRMSNPPFKRKSTPTQVHHKGKHYDAEYEKEREWLLKRLLQEGHAQAGPSTLVEQDDNDGECEDGVECGCCFSTFVFDKMVQCPDAHLFCRRCIVSYASNLLGQHDPKIVCMDQSGCKLHFADSELARILPEKLLSLYHRVKQIKEIEAAGLDGLESCPFCEYKVVIDNPDEKLFRCEAEDCGVVSCRACKKVDHLPKSCTEADEDKHLDVRHKIEEAMTNALMRNCPKCQKPFIKEMGCNKMTCPNCRTLSCYICRKVINGYDHFGQKCQLWDAVERRHDQEVAVARERAMKEARRENPDVEDKALEVELPKTAPANPPGAAHHAAALPHMHHHPYNRANRLQQLQQLRAKARRVVHNRLPHDLPPPFVHPHPNQHGLLELPHAFGLPGVFAFGQPMPDFGLGMMAGMPNVPLQVHALPPHHLHQHIHHHMHAPEPFQRPPAPPPHMLPQAAWGRQTAVPAVEAPHAARPPRIDLPPLDIEGFEAAHHRLAALQAARPALFALPPLPDAEHLPAMLLPGARHPFAGDVEPEAPAMRHQYPAPAGAAAPLHAVPHRPHARARLAEPHALQPVVPPTAARARRNGAR